MSDAEIYQRLLVFAYLGILNVVVLYEVYDKLMINSFNPFVGQYELNYNTILIMFIQINFVLCLVILIKLLHLLKIKGFINIQMKNKVELIASSNCKAKC